jgi:hypothetical protein
LVGAPGLFLLAGCHLPCCIQQQGKRKGEKRECIHFFLWVVAVNAFPIRKPEPGREFPLPFPPEGSL